MAASSTPLETAVRNDRAIVLTSLGALCAVAWVYMIIEARRMGRTGVCECFGLEMSGPDMNRWSVVGLFPLFLMWAEMMVAMMIPSAAPMILMFAQVNRKRRLEERPFVKTGLFVVGYVLVWIGFSVAAALAQWGLHGATLLSDAMKSTSPLLGGMLLIFAGLFQFSPWKRSCLDQCRSPLTFMLTEWREGAKGALVMGVRHGVYCTGCCWFLMTLLFVAGVMNMLWVALITVLVLLEKVLPQRLNLGAITGAVLMAWGIWVMVGR